MRIIRWIVLVGIYLVASQVGDFLGIQSLIFEAEAALPGQNLKCTTLLVGRDASMDGSVLLAHNEDLDGFCAQHYLFIPQEEHEPGEMVALWSGAQVPQVPVTYAYSATTIFDIDYVPGDITSGINEYQVAIANNMATQREAVYPCPSEGRIIWTEFTKLALERAKTAKEAVQVIGELAQTYKLGLDSGTMFGVADTLEGWWVEVAQEGQWVAQRIDNNSAQMRANTYRIGVVDFNDPENFLYSSDPVDYAISRGWYNQDEGPFDFAAVYADPEAAVSPSNTMRHQRVEELLEKSLPAITIQDLVNILRDHYEENTSQDSPHQIYRYPVCNLSTQISVVCQSRGWLPADIGAVCWRALLTPCTSVFVPWYFVHQQIPIIYQRGTDKPTPMSAYWTFRELSYAVENSYWENIDMVREAWDGIEVQMFADQSIVEETALNMYENDPTAAKEYLTNYTNEKAIMVQKIATRLKRTIRNTIASKR